MIYVTRPYLPPLEEYVLYLEKIWENKILTNSGPFHNELEEKLKQYFSVNSISLFSNGTLGIITALQALRITGEVITTPYSFVATTHALLWNGNNPVFVDVDPDTYNINPDLIESAITPRTTAILGVHCYGNPCDVNAIQRIADNYNLKVIYDACHAFGVEDSGGSILRHGDLSVLSFHATKVFNTFEGGAIICPDQKIKQRIDQLKNFGFINETTVVAPGINGKMSEVNAAFGLLQLKYIDKILTKREEIAFLYQKNLVNVDGVELVAHRAIRKNYSYFPIMVTKKYHLSRDHLYEKLKANGIYARKYFYPLISDFPMYRGLSSSRRENIPVAAKAAEQVLCLPIYPDLSEAEVNRICEIIVNP